MDTVRSLLEQLVAIDTTSRRTNLDLIGFVEDRLHEHGIDARRVPNRDGTKANLLARIGPATEGGVVLSAHTDCVPVDEQPWTVDPFSLTREGDRLYGRGTSDMKGFIACMLGALPRLAAAELTRPVVLALSYDEELGTLGAPSLVDALMADHPRPDVAVIGEPTSMRIVDAHKGVRSFTTTVHGRDAHSSQPQRGANAIAALARVAAHIDEIADEVRDQAADPRFEPPFTTFNLATVTGGQAINIIPRRAVLTWEYRPVPADDGDTLRDRVERFAREQVLPRLSATASDAAIETVADAVVPVLAPEDDPRAERLVRELTGSEEPTGTVAYGTDGGHFQQAGISTVVCGPGSIDQAHQPDEWIAVDQLEACSRFLDALVEHLSR